METIKVMNGNKILKYSTLCRDSQDSCQGNDVVEKIMTGGTSVSLTYPETVLPHSKNNHTRIFLGTTFGGLFVPSEKAKRNMLRSAFVLLVVLPVSHPRPQSIFLISHAKTCYQSNQLSIFRIYHLQSIIWIAIIHRITYIFTLIETSGMRRLFSVNHFKDWR